MTERDPLPPHARERRRITGTGTREATWFASPLVAALPLCDLDTWPERYARICVVTPHPDDEVLAFGGGLARLSALHADLRIVAVTDGEAEHGGASGRTPESRAQCRASELRLGLDALAVRADVTRLSIPDGRVDAHRQQLLQALVEQVDEHDLLLVTCRFDGEPDHEACGEVGALVGELTGATVVEYPVWMWHWAKPGEVVVPWNRARRIPLAPAAVDDKRNAIARFRSQFEPDADQRVAPLGTYGLPRFVRPFEVVFV